MGNMNSASLAVPQVDLDEADLLPILVAPHPVLRARCRPVTHADDDQVRELVARMFAAMYRAPGIGLAAPQVGVKLRLAIVDLMADEKKAPIVLITSGLIRYGQKAPHIKGMIRFIYFSSMSHEPESF